MSTLQELAKWITERERAAFVAGAKWSQRADAGSNHIIFTCEAQRRYPGPEAKAEPQDEHPGHNVPEWYVPEWNIDWPQARLPEPEHDTCPACGYWLAQGFVLCAVCGREKP